LSASNVSERGSDFIRTKKGGTALGSLLPLQWAGGFLFLRRFGKMYLKNWPGGAYI
jgi:hypothetical protein